MNLGQAASGAGVACPGAPASHLRVGDSAVVISDPDPVRARSAPVDGDIVDLLYRDYRLSIIGGPECANSMLWWQVQLRDNQTGWVAEGTGDEYFIDLLTPGATTPVAVPAGPNSEALAPGPYMLDITSPETSAADRNPVDHFMLVSTANLTVKSSPNQVLVWVTNVQTGQPIPNAPLTLYERDSGQVGTATTDADGLAHFTRPDDINRDPFVSRVVVLDTGDQFAIGVSSWTSGLDPYNFGFNQDYPTFYRVYLYSDRPIYRPGQPVYFKGVLRHRDDVTYTPATEFQTVPVQIFDERGETVFEQDLPLTSYGTFSGQFNIADDAPLGNYSINVQLPVSSPYRYEGGSMAFSVAEFRTPEFQVEVTPEQTQVVQNDTIQVLVNSQFFFGGAVSDANVDYSVSSQPYYFDYQGQGSL